MALIPDELRAQAQRVFNNEASDSITVRAFLRWFGAQRRGFNVAWNIREALKEVGLTTDPDFRYAWLDGDIRFLAAPPEDENATETPVAGQTDSAVGQPPIETSTTDEPPGDPLAGTIGDPTHRIGQLDAANRGVASVSPDDSIERAVTLMLKNNYSQLPVMTGTREVKGGITWESICKRLLRGEIAHWCATAWNGLVRSARTPQYLPRSRRSSNINMF